jgi:hypothetical protein
MSNEQKLYAQRDVATMGDFYSRHISAMTGEGLHDKSDIAAELAWRDLMLEEAALLIDQMRSALANKVKPTPEKFWTPAVNQAVSVDVSTCDEDSTNRVFGVIKHCQSDGEGGVIWICEDGYFNYGSLATTK